MAQPLGPQALSPTLERLSVTGKGDLIWQLAIVTNIRYFLPRMLSHESGPLYRFHCERSTDPPRISALPPSLTDT
ncbi:MAG: hypothetical protein M1118_03950 [Chloroflexi bacterium]|nr:hypothetical protein [Chloroflexota bacterium]